MNRLRKYFEIFFYVTLASFAIVSIVSQIPKNGSPLSPRDLLERDIEGVSLLTVSMVPLGTQRPPNASKNTFSSPLSEEFERRRDLLREQCEVMRDTDPKGYRNYNIDMIFYNKRYKLLACFTPKAGCSTMKRNMLQLEGFKIANEHSQQSHMLIRAKSLLGIQATEEALMSSTEMTKILTARHPLDRLVSAYRDKYDNGNEVTQAEWKGYARHYLQQTGQLKEKVKLTFTQFLDMTVNYHVKWKEPHTNPIFATCAPCHFSYEYVLHTDTLSQDIHNISRIKNIDEFDSNIHLMTSAKKASSTSYENYYLNVPMDIVQKVINVYKWDFLLFGYELPQSLRNVLIL